MLSIEDNELLCRVGPGTMMGDFLRRFWTPVLRSADLPGPDCDTKEVRILGEDLVAFRDSAGKVGLLQQRCPHRQAPLYYARNEANGLRCIYHGWKFDVTGQCVDMPSEPAESNFKDKVRAKAYPVQEWADIIWAYMGPSHLEPALPELEWARVPASHRSMQLYNQDCNFIQAIEGDLDSSHLGFLHNDGRRPDDLTQRDVAPSWLVVPTDYGLMAAARRNHQPETYYWRTNQWFFPYYTMIAGPLDGRGRFAGQIYVPVDDTHSTVWMFHWSPQEPLDPKEEELSWFHGKPQPQLGSLDRATGNLRANLGNHFLQDKNWQRMGSFTGILGVRDQDAAVVTGMGAIVDRTQEHLGTSDTAIIVMRRQLLNAAKELAQGREPAPATNGALYRVRAWSAIVARDEAWRLLADPAVQQLSETVVP